MRPAAGAGLSAPDSNLLPAGYLHTAGARILDETDRPVRLAGVNWYGFECSSMVAGGLDHQPLDAIVLRIADLGFNHVRLPFSVQMAVENPTIDSYLGANPSLRGRSALDIMDRLIAASGAVGLKVVLDCHRSEAGWSAEGNGLWFTRRYPESVWLATWVEMARRYAANSTAIGCDLWNEPGSPPIEPAAWPRNNGSHWGFGDARFLRRRYPANWPAAAQRAGEAVLGINPALLIFVEGVRSDPAGPVVGGRKQLYWPGGNLMGVGNPGGERREPAPLTFSIPGRLVYSAHDYGPNMHGGLAWGQANSTARDCFDVWDQTWGYIVKQNIAPVWLGEFGTPNGQRPGDRSDPSAYTVSNPGNPQGGWFSHLIAYVADLQANHGGGHWCYWCLNGTQSEAPGRDPARPDWYGLLDPTWSAVASEPLLAGLRTIQRPS